MNSVTAIWFDSTTCTNRTESYVRVWFYKNISVHASDVWVSYQLRYALKAIFRVGRLHKLVPDNLDWHLWAGRHGGIRVEICVARTPQTLISRRQRLTQQQDGWRYVASKWLWQTSVPLATERHCPYHHWSGSRAPRIPGIHGQVPWSVIEPPPPEDGGCWRRRQSRTNAYGLRSLDG